MNWRPGPGYQEKRDAVTDHDFLDHLGLAEEEAITNPSHRQHRDEIDGIVFDQSEEGVMLSFTVDDDGVVILLSFADLFNS